MGAQIDLRSDDNRTSFLMAVATGNLDTARMLLESGTDVHACTKDMKNCLHLAVENGRLEMVELLLGNTEVKDNLYRSDILDRVPLHNAAISPNVKVSFSSLLFFSRFEGMHALTNNWFMASVRLSSYGCTWEVSKHSTRKSCTWLSCNSCPSLVLSNLLRATVGL